MGAASSPSAAGTVGIICPVTLDGVCLNVAVKCGVVQSWEVVGRVGNLQWCSLFPCLRSRVLSRDAWRDPQSEDRHWEGNNPGS